MERTSSVQVQTYDLDDHSFEDVEDYAPGGLHPTHLGDLLGEDRRYRVVLKLGHGGYGTVWLCRDTKEEAWRAVKILRASGSTEDCAELRFHAVFSDMDSRRKSIAHSRIAFALDHFWISGPNGTHLCLVMPLLGPNIENASQRYLCEEAPLMGICRQLVQAMAFLHDRGVCHGDFRPHNACFILKGIENLGEDEIIQAFGMPKLMWLGDDDQLEGEAATSSDRAASEDGSPDETERELDTAGQHEGSQANTPRYLVSKSYMDPNSPHVSHDIAVVDFGESFLVSEPPEETGIPCHYGAPESLFDGCGDLGFGSDLWALGCTICQVRVGSEPFFDIGDIWHLMKYWENLNGPLPEPYRSSLVAEEDLDIPEDGGQYVSTDLEDMEELEQEHLRRTGVTGSLHNILLVERRFQVPLQEGEEPSPSPPRTSSTRGRMHAEPGHKIVAVEMSRREASQLMDLFKRIFTWKPSDRIPAAEILSLPCFANYCNEGICCQESQRKESDEFSDVATASQSGSDLPMLHDANRALESNCGFTLFLALWREFLRAIGL
jgi:serine/threonine protein kinase